MRARTFFALLAFVLLASRLCHLGILWTEENLPMAAAAQMLDGKTLYRDVWFDKPPLTPAVYLLWGARTGWPLRVAGALFALLCCALLYRFARQMWSEREGRVAAALLGFFLICGIPAAVLPLAADLLLVAPHIAAVWLAYRGRPFWSGLLAGIGLLFNAKAVFVLAACALWQYRALPALLAGFALPALAAAAWMGAQGALRDCWEQVCLLGRLYARHTFLEHPFRDGLLRTANWFGFHLALALGAAAFWWRERKPDAWRLAAWAALSLAAVAAGWRFFPRYYFQLLPVMALAGARGYMLLGRKRLVLLLALLIPLARFAPRYVLLASDLVTRREHAWRDVAMDQDSRRASEWLRRHAGPGDTLFVWGYRPEVYVYTRLPAATRFLESQPLSGVFADRHLTASGAVAPEAARARRGELARSRPDFVLDGLALYNPGLSVESYPDLRAWLANYEPAARTGHTLIYRRKASQAAASGAAN